MITSAQLQGHWVRRWIKAPGFEDHKTRVHWMQAGMIYADVRIPLDRPDLGSAQALADLTPSQLLQLARAEGFAGETVLNGSECTWHRHVNWHGKPDAADIGDIRFDEDGLMYETGVLADYTELWEQSAKGPSRAVTFRGGGYDGLMVHAGGVAVLGIGKLDRPATDPILRALEQNVVPRSITTLFDGCHAYCTWDGSQAISQLSTDPFAEGHPVLTRTPEGLVWHRIGFDGARQDVVMAEVALT